MDSAKLPKDAAYKAALEAYSDICGMVSTKALFAAVDAALLAQQSKDPIQAIFEREQSVTAAIKDGDFKKGMHEGFEQARCAILNLRARIQQAEGDNPSD